jgi:hypothetical protein
VPPFFVARLDVLVQRQHCVTTQAALLNRIELSGASGVCLNIHRSKIRAFVVDLRLRFRSEILEDAASDLLALH